MVKIKRKVALGPKAFLKHLLEQEETEVELDGYTSNGEIFSFDPEVTVNEFVSYNPNNNTYTVEIEEEITEETVLKRFYEYTKGQSFMIYEDTSISKIKDELSKEFWMKDGNTMTLLWKDGELVGDE